MCTHSHTQTQTLCRFTVVYILLHQYFWTGTLASAGVTIKIETLLLFFFFCCFSISPIPLQTASLLWACNGSVTHIYLLTSLGLVHCNLLELDMFCVCAWCREREREREGAYNQEFSCVQFVLWCKAVTYILLFPSCILSLCTLIETVHIYVTTFYGLYYYFYCIAYMYYMRLDTKRKPWCWSSNRPEC